MLRERRLSFWSSLVALLACFSMVAVACGGDDDGGGTSAPSTDTEGDTDGTTPGGTVEGELGEPVQGGELVFGTEAEVDGLNPTNNAFDATGYVMGRAVLDPLMVFDENSEIQPYLAETVEPNEDFTQWTITLREGVTFHDGTPLTTEALQVGLEAQVASPLVGNATRTLLPEEDPITIVDDLTATVNLKSASANFPAYMTTQLGMVGSPDWVREIETNEDAAQEPIGTGPFKFVSRERNRETVFERNDDWWAIEALGESIYLDRIIFQPIPDSDTRTNSLLTGSIQGLHTTTAANTIQMQDAGDQLKLILDDTGEESFVMINTATSNAGPMATNPFTDIRARQALTYATPRQEYIDIIGEGEENTLPANSIFYPDSEYYVADVVQEADDIGRAQELAAEFCADVPDKCTDGKINMQYMYVGPSAINEQIRDILRRGWDQVFNVDVQTVQQDAYIQLVALGSYHVVTWRQFGAVDPDSDMVWIQCETVNIPVSINWPRVCDEARDELLNAQRVSTDPEERTQLWAQIVQNIHDAYTYVFLTHTKWALSFDATVTNLCGAKATADTLQRCTTNGSMPLHQVWIAS